MHGQSTTAKRKVTPGNTTGGKYQCTIDLLFDWFGISCMTDDNFCFYLQNRQIKTGQTGGQRYSDTSPFSIPWVRPSSVAQLIVHSISDPETESSNPGEKSGRECCSTPRIRKCNHNTFFLRSI